MACTTSQKTIAYKTIFSVEKSTTAAYDGYITAVLNGQARTNEVPVVSKRYNQFQASVLVALDATQFNTNALAPDLLVVESMDIINFVTTLKAKK